MDVTKIRLIGLHTVDLPLSVAQPSDPFIVKAADGLGPTGNDLAITGRVYQGRVPINRQLVFRIGLTPNFKLNETPASLREKLYGMLTPTTEDDSVPVQFMKDNVVVAQTVGRVSKIEVSVFAKEPEVQLTMECTEPYLESPVLLTAEPENKATFVIRNEGSAPTGFHGAVIFTGSLSTWTLTVGTKKMTFEYPFQNGDILTFSTHAGRRFIRRMRNGVDLPILQALTRDSTWIQLHGGDNVFTTSSQAFNWGYIRYRPLYLGV